jgi:hypothetical protein
MRYILLVILILVSFGVSAQAPPMSIGGPQGINVKRILAQDWMSVPIMADTPVAPLTGSGWPGKGYVVFVAQNPDSVCFGCPPADTSLWEYTGARWKRVGMDYLTKLVFGGEVTPSSTVNRRFFVGSYGAFINGNYYTNIAVTTINTSPKVADSTSRIDAIVITPNGPQVKVGTPRRVPLKPSISENEIELSTVYFPPFDTVPRFIPVATGVTSVFRVAGRDSIYYTIDTVTFAIKDSIGISVATNGLTASDKTIKLGGSLTENTNINLSSSRLNVFTGSDTARFVNNGDLNLILKGAGTNQSVITKDFVSSTNTSNGKSAFLDYSGSLGLNNGTYESYLDNLGVTNPLVTLRFPNKPTGDYIIATTSDTVNLSNRINTKLNISDTAAMLNNYKFTAANGLTKDSTVFRLGGSLNQNTDINLSTRRLNVLAGSDTARFFANGSLSIGATPSDSTYRFNVNGGAKMDSLVVDSLYAKFGGYIGDGSTPFAPIEFRATSGNRTRIDLRPASNAGWNNNWYGAITHNGTETDIFCSNYGSLYLGSSSWLGGAGVYIGNTRNNPSMYIRNNNNVLVGDTANTGFRFDVNGKARVRDTLTLATAPVTSDTTANDLLVINSSNGQVRRYTGAWYSVPLEGSATLDFGNTSAQNSADLTITVTGAAAGDVVSLGVPNASVNANTCFTAWVSATDTVTVRFNNYSSGAIDPASGTFKIKVFK